MISHASITNTYHSVLAREFSRVWGGRWHLSTSVADTNILVYRDGEGPVFGALAPEWWATMRERGIDPATGHKKSCRRR